MYVMIDNFDSFVYNLKAYFQELGREILVRRYDEITLEELEELNPEGSSFLRDRSVPGMRSSA